MSLIRSVTGNGIGNRKLQHTCNYMYIAEVLIEFELHLDESLAMKYSYESLKGGQREAVR